ncbi:universal stress protein [Nocardioides nitrophenolicus]|uniref:universal stress protein n=1 Tax=Nocardioides nitrophenolicus TaxID=60489 RepID=UPI001959F809|nr:universal stress protein [Nocardioides nitrophenolicus]MBM7518476.1 nucleotide-binding universal stress UspA family protein [Nocardioides nitrophenolicus]
MTHQSSTGFELGRDGTAWIVAGVDGSVTSERAGAYAAGLARRQGSRLALVLARDLSTEASLGQEQAVRAAIEGQDEVERSLRAAIAQTQWPVDVELFVRTGPPARVIAEVAEELAAGLIVLGSSRQHAYLRPGGPLPVQLMRLRRWPVLVVP